MPGATVNGAAAMRDKFLRLKAKLPSESAAALRIETEVEATEVKRRTPVWNPARPLPKGVTAGALRASVHVIGPLQEVGTIYTLIVAGGATAPYALWVHEDLEAFHATGQAEFIRSVILESRSFIAARVAKRIELNRVMA